MSKEKPIIFSTEMVKAILDGRKTMTRRVVKKKYNNTDIEKRGDILIEIQNDTPPDVYNPETKMTTRHLKMCASINKPYNVGDILWVRETWSQLDADYKAVTGKFDIEEFNGCPIVYKADENPEHFNYWRSSIHMPRAAARIFIKVKDVRVERLQEITAEDALNEGVWVDAPSGVNPAKPKHWDEWSEKQKDKHMEAISRCVYISQLQHVESIVKEFSNLWDRINAKRGYGWDLNPWVWVIELERMEIHG